MDLCYNAEYTLCEDLLGFTEVIEYKTSTQLFRLCKDMDVVACAVIDFENKQCTIFIKQGKDLTHERNHCRGWSHGEVSGRYQTPWKPFPEIKALQNE